jgi:flagellar hook assembly protein FlgD
VGCEQVPNPTDVPEGRDQIAAPSRTALHQNTPNPFNPTTVISFDLARDSHVSLKIYDVAGRLVRGLANEKMVAGFGKQVKWDGFDDSGNRVSSGVYFYRLVAGDITATRKMVVMK